MTKHEFMAMSLPYGLKIYVENEIDCSTNGEDFEYDEIAGVIDVGIYEIVAIKSKQNIIIEGDVVMIDDQNTSAMTTFNKIAPILHQLSDLTKEIEHNGEKFVPIVELAILVGFSKVDNNCFIDSGAFLYKIITNDEIEFTFNKKHNCFYAFDKEVNQFLCFNNQLKSFQKLIEWHFDIAGLIESGEAIDVNTLEINPYK